MYLQPFCEIPKETYREQENYRYKIDNLVPGFVVGYFFNAGGMYLMGDANIVKVHPLTSCDIGIVETQMSNASNDPFDFMNLNIHIDCDDYALGKYAKRFGFFGVSSMTNDLEQQLAIIEKYRAPCQ